MSFMALFLVEAAAVFAPKTKPHRRIGSGVWKNVPIASIPNCRSGRSRAVDSTVGYSDFHSLGEVTWKAARPSCIFF